MRRIVLGFLAGVAVGYALANRDRVADPEILVDIAGVPDELRRAVLGEEP